MTRSPALTSCAVAGAASTAANRVRLASPAKNVFMESSLLSLSCRRSSERVFRRQHIGPARERMEQEILLIEDIIDAEVEREVVRRVVVDLRVHHEEIVESA